MSVVHQAGFEVRRGGSAIDGRMLDRITFLKLDQELHAPSRLELRMRDDDFSLLDSAGFRIGERLDVEFGAMGTAPEELCSTEVVSVGVDQTRRGRHEVVVVGLDRGHRLHRGTVVHSYVKTSLREIARDVAARNGLRADVERSVLEYEHVFQASTDFAFLSRIAAREGTEWWVDDDVLRIRRADLGDDAGTATWGENLIRFKVAFVASDHAEAVEVRSWDPENQKPIVGVASFGDRSGSAVGSDAPLVEDCLRSAGAGTSGRQRLTGAMPSASLAEAETVAGALADRAIGEQLRGRGEVTGNPAVRPGRSLTVEGMGRSISGAYLVSSAQHVVGDGVPYTTRFTVGHRADDDLGAGVGHEAQEVTWASRGPVMAVVTNVSDPSDQGRVKLRYPALGDQDESYWARVVSPGAGASRGIQIPLEVDDEVAVVFEHGDLSRPIVLGGVWSGKNRNPFLWGKSTVGKPADRRKVWQSGEGHSIQFVDGKASKDRSVLISLSDGRTKIAVAEDGITIESPKDIRISTKSDLAFDATGAVSISGRTISIAAKQRAELAGSTVSVSADVSAELKGATAAVRGTAAVDVKGGAVTVGGTPVKIG